MFSVGELKFVNVISSFIVIFVAFFKKCRNLVEAGTLMKMETAYE
jgi:hypothetical protein